MIKKILSAFLIFVLLLIIKNCNSHNYNENKPKLVVLIAVDGLGMDMMNRYKLIFHGGFLRLQTKGVCYDSAFIDHGITVSHAGHVTLSTGNHPSKHGIVDAAYYEPKGNTRILADAVQDTLEGILGENNSPGVSPRKILSTGLKEWLKNADPNSKSMCLGTGYVSSLLYASTPGNVYWYSRNSGKYVTSSFYTNEYPKWVKKFNTDSLTLYKNLSKKWECSIPGSIRYMAHNDSSEYEADGIYTTFPHYYETEMAEKIPYDKNAINTWFAWTPFADASTLSLAKAGIQELLLGQGESTDFLSIVLSQIDNICHYYGPNSLEAMDALLRLDAELKMFFEFLDKTVGEENYVLALSSDHGFPEIPEYRIKEGKDGKRINDAELDKLLSEVESTIGDSSVFSINTEVRVAKLLKKQNFIADVYTSKELLSKNVTNDDFLRLYKNSYRKNRIPRLPLFSLSTFESSIGKAGVMLRLKEGAMISLDVVIHGSPYDYDRHVPMYFLSTDVDAGIYNQKVSTTDVAPTLAKLAGIKFPSDLDGKALIK